MSNQAENAFISYAKHSFKVFRHGWPDFFAQHRKTKKFLGIEVKHGADKLKPSQRVMFAALESMGFQVVIWNPKYPKLLTPWRNYTPPRTKVERKPRPKLPPAFFIRLNADVHARITELSQRRGRPHSITSVASEMLSKGLKAAKSELTKGKEP